jgi:hypothetical protein
LIFKLEAILHEAEVVVNHGGWVRLHYGHLNGYFAGRLCSAHERGEKNSAE